jgi:hypothetical protein
MEILLCKPDGKREGPYTLEQVNAGLVQKRFKDTDYWAWYEGLESWVPLHQVPGIMGASRKGAAEPPKPPQQKVAESPEDQGAPDEDTQFISSPSSVAKTDSGSGKSPLWSGMPIESLEQIFVFTDGEGPAAMQSSVTTVALQAVTAADLQTIRGRATRDVFARCDIPQKLAEENKVPASAWRAMSALRPELVKKSREGACKVCVRVLETETGQKVAVFLFYKK